MGVCSELLPIAYAGRRFTTYKRKALGRVKAFYFPVPTALYPSCTILSRIWHFANSRVSSLEDVAHHAALDPDGWRCLGCIFKTVNEVYFTQMVLSLGGSGVQARASATAAGSCVSSQGTVDDLVAGELSSCLTFKSCAECSILSKRKRKYSG